MTDKASPLPRELLRHTMTFLPYESIIACRRVNQFFYRATQAPNVWSHIGCNHIQLEEDCYDKDAIYRIKTHSLRISIRHPPIRKQPDSKPQDKKTSTLEDKANQQFTGVQTYLRDEDMHMHFVFDLLRAGLSINHTQNKENTFSVCASRPLSVETYKKLEEIKATPNNSQDAYNTLHQAIKASQPVEVINILLDAGCQPVRSTLTEHDDHEALVSDTFTLAITKNYPLQILQRLYMMQGRPLEKNTLNTALESHSRVDVIEFILEIDSISDQKCSLDKVVLTAIRNYYPSYLINCLVDHGAPVQNLQGTTEKTESTIEKAHDADLLFQCIDPPDSWGIKLPNLLYFKDTTKQGYKSTNREDFDKPMPNRGKQQNTKCTGLASTLQFGPSPSVITLLASHRLLPCNQAGASNTLSQTLRACEQGLSLSALTAVMRAQALPSSSQDEWNTLSCALSVSQSPKFLDQFLIPCPHPHQGQGPHNSLNCALKYNAPPETIWYLLEKQCLPSNKDGAWNTINCALRSSITPDILRRLIDSGAKPCYAKSAWNSLRVALRSQHPKEIIEILILKEENDLAGVKSSAQPLKAALEDKTHTFNTAVKYNASDEILILLNEHGIKPNSEQNPSNSITVAAKARAPKSKFCLLYGLEAVQDISSGSDDTLSTALRHGCSVEVIEFLLMYGARFSCLGNASNSFHSALLGGCPIEVFKLISKHRILPLNLEVDPPRAYTTLTPISFTSANSFEFMAPDAKPDGFPLIINHLSTINTALYTSASPEIFRCLCRAGALPSKGQTPYNSLSVAAIMNARPEVFDILIANGAEPNQRTIH